MPMFDFKCPECNHIRENKIIKVNELDDFILECPECGANMKRLVGLSRFKMGKSCFVKVNPSAAEQKKSEAIMEDYKLRAKGERI